MKASSTWTHITTIPPLFSGGPCDDIPSRVRSLHSHSHPYLVIPRTCAGQRLQRMRVEKDDIHAKLMRNYPEVPDWWYGVAFVTFFACEIIAMEVWKTGVPIWGLLLAVLLPVAHILPSGFIYAMTGKRWVSLALQVHCPPPDCRPNNRYLSTSLHKLSRVHCYLETPLQTWYVACLVSALDQRLTV